MAKDYDVMPPSARPAFTLKPVSVTFEHDSIKQAVLRKTVRQFGMNKSTQWYQRKMLRERGTFKPHGKTRQRHNRA